MNSMARWCAALAWWALAGCSSTTGGGDGGVLVDDARHDAVLTDSVAGGLECNSDTTCPAGRACCLASGRCYSPGSDPGACPAPAPITDPGVNGAAACSSNAQCSPSQFCAGFDGTCVGRGFCIERASCGSCRGIDCAVCGCDGVTYRDPCAAVAAGVRGVLGACGVGSVLREPDGGMRPRIGCGDDPSACGAGQLCCAITGLCFDASEPGFCALPTPGGTFCRDNLDCLSSEYCAAAACSGPGRCARISARASCDTGVLAPVCGCDGVTYSNECYAGVARTRVAHTGNCM